MNNNNKRNEQHSEWETLSCLNLTPQEEVLICTEYFDFVVKRQEFISSLLLNTQY